MVRSTNNGVYLSTNSHFDPLVPIDMIHEKLRSLGYPLPEKNCRGMKFINGFEKKFPCVDVSCRSVLKDLSEEVALKLSCSVVSLASFNGNTRLFACTGILIKCTSVLTSASLFRSSNDENTIDDDLRVVEEETPAQLLFSLSDRVGLANYKLYSPSQGSYRITSYSTKEMSIKDSLRSHGTVATHRLWKLSDVIEVCLANKQIVTGKLQHCSLHYNIAVVNIMASPDLHTANLYHEVQFEPCCKVVAVGRIFATGSLTATSGTLPDEPSNFDCTELLTSTCIITKAGIGGPLVDFDGNFLGMNFYGEGKTPFTPRNIILECLRHFETKRSITASSTIDCNLNRWHVPKPYWVYPANDWDSGYQKINFRAVPANDWDSAPLPMLL